MSAEREKETKKEQNREITPERRKRINRLKKIIVRTVVFMILIPVTGCIILGMKLYRAKKSAESMKRQINFLESALRDSVDAADRAEALLRINEEILQGSGSSGISEIVEDMQSEAKENVSEAENIREVYLTFDDGPSIYTEEILDILAQYNVKATFFVTGKRKEGYGDVYRRIVEEGHTLGMHSYSHEYGNIYASLENFQEDLETLRNFLYNETGVVSQFYRFPGGSSNNVSQTDIHEMTAYLKAMDIEYFDWNISAGDAMGASLSSGQIVSRVMNQIPSHRVAMVLMHDAADKHSTVEALPELIEEIQAMEDTEIVPITKETMRIQHVSSE